ncbi:MAG: hypothetical protein V4590_10020 [Bacteroidota bacterium]
MVKKLLQYYQIFCNLSLDVVLGVICCMLPLPSLFHISLPLSWYITLPLGTWFIYLADHVVDVTRKTKDYPSPRHRFIKRNLRSIIAIMVCISVVIAWQVLHPFSTLLFTVGSILAAIVVLHLFIVRINPTRHSWYNNKELAISIIYAAGIYAAPVMVLHQQGTSILLPIYCAFLLAVIAFINLLMASILELKWDEEMDNTSLVRVMGMKASIFLFNSLLLVCGFGIGLFLRKAPVEYAPMLLCYLVMALSHFFIYKRRHVLLNHLAYRKLSEALFWLPALAWLLG